MNRILQLCSVLLLISSLQTANGQVAIGTGSTAPTPIPNAVLLLVGNGTNQGLVIPSVRNSDLSTFGSAGMVVYNSTNNTVHFHNGTAWNQVGAGGSGTQGIQISGNTVSLTAIPNAGFGLSSPTPTATGQLLVWNGTGWESTPAPTTTGQTLSWNQTTGKWTIGNPSGGALPSLSANQLLSNNGANTGIIVAGDLGLSVTGTTGTFTVANNAINTAKLANNAVDATKIANGAVGITQLANGPANNVLTTNASGVPTWASGGGSGITSLNISSSGGVNYLSSAVAGNNATITTNAIVNNDISATANISGTKLQDGTLPVSKIASGSAANNQVLQFNSGSWAPATLPGAVTGNLTTSTTGISITGGTNAVIGAGATINIQNASTSQGGLLTQTDWNTFNNKLSSASAAGGELSGTLSTLTINNNAITTTKINNGAVTIAKIGTAGVPDANKVLTTDASGVPQWTVAAGGGDMLKSTYDPTNINGSAFNLSNHTGQISTAQITDANVTNIKLATGLDAAKITTGTLPASVIPVSVIQNTTSAGGDLTGTYPNPLLSTSALTGSTIVTAINNTIAVISGSRVDPSFGTQAISTNNALSVGPAGSFAVNSSGNITKINGATTSFPAANAAGVLTNDGTGILTWGAGSGWGLTGNAGTNPAINFIGTTGLQDLVFRTNNTEFARLTSAGKLGIGTTAPSAFLDVQNASASGNAGSFNVSNAANTGSAVFANKNGTTGAAYQAIVTGGAEGLNINQNGAGYGLDVIVSNTLSGNSAIVATHNGIGSVIAANATGTGSAANLSITNSASPATALSVTTVGTGPAAIFNGGNVGIGGAPSQRLDVVGNVKFSGALMPNNLPGTTGQVLTSAGAGLPPTWSSGSGWGLTGTAGTVDGTNFVGTTDNVPLSFIVNNEKAGRIDHIKNNTFFGYRVGALNTSGVQNAASGSNAFSSNTTGSFNTVYGNGALYSNTTGADNTAIGAGVLLLNNDGDSNTAIGSSALASNSNGSNNTANGYQTLKANTTGAGNTASGLRALFSNMTGSNNVAAGAFALYSNTIGDNNIANGYLALYSNTTGTKNTAIGSQADVAVGNLTNATAIGYNAKVGASNSLVLGGTGVDEVNVGINTTSPTQRLDVVGNVKFSGALMPNNLPGTSGQVLTSAGAGVAPTWTSVASSISPANTLIKGNAGGTAQVASQIFDDGTSVSIASVPTTNITKLTVENQVSGGPNSSVSGTKGLRVAVADNGNSQVFALEARVTGANTGQQGGIWSSAEGTSGFNRGVVAGAKNSPGTNIAIDAYTESNTGTNYGIRSNITGGAAVNYGIYVNAAGAGVKYGIFSQGEDTNYFSGNVGIGNPSPSVALDIQATDAIIIPDGTNAQRPAATIGAGAIRYNTDLGMLEYSDGTTWHSLVPPGTIVAYGGATAPAGWLICDGTTYNNATYPKLFAAIGTAYGAPTGTQFRVPDFRGKFLRGVDGTASYDPNAAARIAQYTGGNGGNAVGSLQSDAMQGHSHRIDVPYSTTSLGSNQRIALSTSTAGSTNWNASTMLTDGTNGTPRISGETRPVNVYVNYIIKY